MPTFLLGDQNTLSDAAAGFAPYFVAFSDSISLSDAIIASGAVFRTNIGVADRIFLTDAIAFSTAGLGILIGDSLNFVDSLSSARTQANNVSDTLSLSDALTVTQTQGFSFSDSITLSDAAIATPGSIFVNLTVVALDTLFLIDSLGMTSPNTLFVDRLFLSDSTLVVFPSTLNPYLRRYLNDVS